MPADTVRESPSPGRPAVTKKDWNSAWRRQTGAKERIVRISAEALGAESFPRTVMCLAVFAERGLVTVERHDKYITLRLTGGKRVDLDASPYLCALREGLDGTKGGSSV